MTRGGGRGGHAHAARRQIDLTGIISIAEKNDLLTLVNAITEKMHNEISNIFDSPPVSPVAGEVGHHNWLSLSLLHLKDKKENVAPSSEQLGKETSSSYKTTHNIIEKEEKEAMTPQLRELKKEALTFFRKWQAALLQRLRDVGVNDPQAPQGNVRGRGRGNGFRGGFRGRGGRGGSASRGGLTLATGPPRLPTRHTDANLAKLYPPIPNTLWTVSQDKRKLFLHIVFLSALSLSEYTSNTHQLLMYLTSSLNVPLKFFRAEEMRLCQALAQAALDVSPEDLVNQKAEEAKAPRRWKGNHQSSNNSLAPALTNAGIGTASGSFGLTICAAAGLLGTMSDVGRSLCNFFGMNPAKPTSKMMEVFSREIQEFAFLPLHGNVRSEYTDARERPACDRRFRLTIAMGGWSADEGDVRAPWKCLGRQTEVYAVRWDPMALMNLGASLETVIKSTAWSRAQEEIKARTIFTSLLESKWPVSLLKISKIIDNPWSVGMVRAEKAGAVLADAIMRHRFQGERPVSLVGYSLAARAIYACLMVLAERRQFGLVDSVVLMGAPVPSESRVWLTLKSVVSSRLVNVYSEHDYLLGFLYRFSNIQFGVAGLQEIQGAEGVESYDVGTLPRGHLGYEGAIPGILRSIDWDDLDRDEMRNARPTK